MLRISAFNGGICMYNSLWVLQNDDRPYTGCAIFFVGVRTLYNWKIVYFIFGIFLINLALYNAFEYNINLWSPLLSTVKRARHTFFSEARQWSENRCRKLHFLNSSTKRSHEESNIRGRTDSLRDMPWRLVQVTVKTHLTPRIIHSYRFSSTYPFSNGILPITKAFEWNTFALWTLS